MVMFYEDYTREIARVERGIVRAVMNGEDAAPYRDRAQRLYSERLTAEHNPERRHMRGISPRKVIADAVAAQKVADAKRQRAESVLASLASHAEELGAVLKGYSWGNQGVLKG